MPAGAWLNPAPLARRCDIPPSSSHFPPGHPTIPPESGKQRLGVLLINLGTPAANTVGAVREYLAEFLADPRVIEVNRTLWWFILNLVILRFRPRISAHAYAKIYDAEAGDFPLRRFTREQAEGLARRFGEGADAGPGAVEVDIDWAMRYGIPGIEEKLTAMQARGCRRILLFALYPQYSATTTATAYDKAFAVLAKMRWQPAVRAAPPYHDEPAYIEALASSVRAHLATLDREPDKLLVSMHGLPQKYFAAGDPYHCHCAKTARLLTEALGWPEERVMLVFQSRFGRAEWLQPYALEVIRDLPREGVRRIAVIAPCFAVDCVETLEEVALGLRDSFLEAGGEEFSYIPCLNAGEASLTMLDSLIRRELSGWL